MHMPQIMVWNKCSTCNIVKTALSFIFTAAMTAAIIGAVEGTSLLVSPNFGSVEASLAILALTVTLMLWTTNLDCSGCPNPTYQNWIVFTFLVLATLASLCGLYQAHFRTGIFVAGTPEGSLAILTFAIVATQWAKNVQSLCESCRINSGIADT